MKKIQLLQRFLSDESGVLSLEWILLIIFLTIGLVGGTAALRDVTIAQFGNVASAAGHLDQSCGYENCPYLTDGTYTDSRAQNTSVITAE